MRRVILLLMCWLLSFSQHVVAFETPKVLLDGWKMDQIRCEPDLVTPIGCRFDNRGRLFVVECHTHFPPEGYTGPKADRIYMFSDSDGDGILDQQKLFYEGGRATMGLAIHPEGGLLVATRSEINHIRDTNGDDQADNVQNILKLDTQADYPHNGLSSIVIGPDGLLYIGHGENFGAPYQLVSRNGSKQTGSGEGGNIFRCRLDGSQLERYATGFWNPFGTCFDSAGRLWTVDNDPDSRPPCRLIHVVESADYGFQFRFGRAGTNPLLAWNGELPGTLPMAAGTGEAPCAVMPYGNKLWVTSWGDNRIELFALKQEGSTWKADFETAVQGDTSFRPADMAIAPDGSIYITDWVDRSYPVHSKGRLWRLFKNTPDTSTLPALSKEEKTAAAIASGKNVSEIWKLAHSSDPYSVQAAVAGIARHFDPFTMQTPAKVAEQTVWLQACRWKELNQLASVNVEARRERLLKAFTNDDSSIRRLAIRYAAETGDKLFLDPLKGLVNQAGLEANEFAELISAIAYLETGDIKPKDRDPKQELLLSVVGSRDRSADIRAMALRSMPANASKPTSNEILSLIKEVDHWEFRRQAIWLLASRKNESAASALLQLAVDAKLPEPLRADAVSGLAASKDALAKELKELGNSASTADLVKAEVNRLFASSETSHPHPLPTDSEAWWKSVGTGGDRQAGMRVFMRSVCVTCHAYEGRGAQLAPDLSTLRGTQNRRKLLQSILEPSREIGPLYLTWKIRTTDGRVLTGTKLNGGGVATNLKYLAADGTTFELRLDEIEEQQASAISIMPADAYKGLTINELRDLLALLE